MARKSKSQEQALSGSPSGRFTNFSPKPIQANRAPTTEDTGFAIGQLWVDITSNTIYGLSGVSGGSATWSVVSNDPLPFATSTNLILTQSPIMQTDVNTGGVPTGGSGDINLMALQDGAIMEQFIIGTQTIIAPRMTLAGLSIGLDNTVAEGAEYNFGTRNNSKHSFTIGTAPAFFIRVVLEALDISGCNPLVVGFRKIEANNALIANYTDTAAIGLLNVVSSTNVVIVDQLNGGGQNTTDTTVLWGGDATNQLLEVLVSETGVVTYEIDGSPPTVTSEFTFDNGDVVMPFIHFLNGADVAGLVSLRTLQVGLQF